MERLISLFKEADYERWSLARPRTRDEIGLGADPEPVYFRQLLGYLREQRLRASQSRSNRRENEPAEALIGGRE